MRVVVLDFDGPIFDGRKAADQAITETADHFASQFGTPALRIDAIPLYGPRRIISILYPHQAMPERETIESFYKARLKIIERQVGIPTAVSDCLDALIGEGLALGLYSARSLSNLQPLLQDLGLLRYFAVPELGCTPKYQKPSGAFLKCIAEHHRVKVSDVLFVGDSDWDYQAANDVGAIYYHAGWTREPSANATKHAALVVNSLAELVDIVRDVKLYSDVPTDEAPLWEYVHTSTFSFYAGAGVSIQSHLGEWESHYRPLLAKIGASYLSSETDLPEVVGMLSARPLRAKTVFDNFRLSFKGAGPAPKCVPLFDATLGCAAHLDIELR